MNWERARPYLLLTALCVFINFFGNTVPSLTDPDDTFYAESAKEMLSHHSILTPFIFDQPQFEKPPLYFWLLMISFKAFGVNTFAARLVPALFGIMSVLGTFMFLRRLYDQRIALISAAILATSMWWIGLSRVVLTDMVFCTLIAISFYVFFTWFRLGKGRYLFLFAVFSALATLTKGPLGLLMPLLSVAVFLLLMKDYRSLKTFLLGRWWLIWLLLVLPWYMYAAIKYGNAFLWEFFVNCHWNRLIHSEHEGFNTWYFYPAIIVLGLFPWTCYFAFVGRAFRKYKIEHLFLFSWIGVCFVVFSVAQSKLSTYISPLFPPLAILIGFSLVEADGRSRRNLIAALLLLLFSIGLLLPLKFLDRQEPQLVVPVLLSFGALSLASLVAGVLMMRHRVKAAAVTSGVGMLAFVLITPLVLFPKLETALTDSDLETIIPKYNYQGKTILCNSLTVRGVHFYADNPVVVMAATKSPFWSKHPVEIISTDDEIHAFLSTRDTVLCVITSSGLALLNRLTSEIRDNNVLSHNIERVVILSTQIHPANSSRQGDSLESIAGQDSANLATSSNPQPRKR